MKILSEGLGRSALSLLEQMLMRPHCGQWNPFPRCTARASTALSVGFLTVLSSAVTELIYTLEELRKCLKPL